jgi:hypothetical protein
MVKPQKPWFSELSGPGPRKILPAWPEDPDGHENIDSPEALR